MSDEIEISRYTYHCFSSRDRNDVVLFLYDERHDGRAVLYFHRAAIPQLVDLLRNEGPVYLLWNDGRNTALATGYEPIGEGEVT